MMMVTLGIPYTLSPGHSGVLGRDGCPNAALRPLLELGDDLLVRRGEGGRRWGCLWGSGGPFDTLDDVGQPLDRAQIGRRRVVDQLLDHQFALGDPAPPSILGEADLLVERRAEP